MGCADGIMIRHRVLIDLELGIYICGNDFRFRWHVNVAFAYIQLFKVFGNCLRYESYTCVNMS